MFFGHDLKWSCDGSLFTRQMTTEIFLKFNSQQFETQLRIAVIFAVERHPRCFTFGSHRIFEIILLNWNLEI